MTEKKNRLTIYEPDNYVIKVYYPFKQELLATFTSFKEASKYTGLTAKSIRQAGLAKTRRFSERLQLEIAIRISSQ